MMAGAHRNANGSNTADPGYLTNTVFHAVHEAWSGVGGENTAWQIHGYSAANHSEFPGNCMAVLSTGENAGDSMSSNVVTLDQQMEWNSVKTYAYNDSLAATNVLNQLVNEGVAGTNFASLAATHNVQGKASRARGGTFVHIELVTVVRTNAVLRTHAADAIANAILRSRTNAPLLEFPSICSVASVTNQFVFASTSMVRYAAYLAETSAAMTTGAWNVLYSFPGEDPLRAFTNAMTNATGFFRLRAQ
jgi:hypothetical protein